MESPMQSNPGVKDESDGMEDSNLAGYEPISEGDGSCPSGSANGSINGHYEGNGVGIGGATVRNGQRPQESIVTVNGMDFHVYGNVRGLELLSLGDRQQELLIPDSDEEEEEERRRVDAERAIAEANQADAARRAAPIPPEQRARIVNAMKGIDLGGFRPSWADSVPEHEWIKKITGRVNSSE